jgi:hypothetical protein
MSNSDLFPSLLFKINQNQLALEATIMELTLWVEQRGSGKIARTPGTRHLRPGLTFNESLHDIPHYDLDD